MNSGGQGVGSGAQATAELHATPRIPHDGRTIVTEDEGVVREERLIFMPFAAERFSKVAQVIAAILTPVIPSAPTGAVPSPILEQAARGIESHRKGDATIRFVRKDGTPTAGLKVEAIPRTHSFAQAGA